MAQHGVAPFTECSSRGEKRFSNFYARIRNRGNRSIEDIYQRAKIFADGSTGLDSRVARNRTAVNTAEISELFSSLWSEYLSENPDLLALLMTTTGLSNKFTQAENACEAEELWRLRDQHIAAQASNPITAPIAGVKLTLAIIGTAGRKDDAAKLSSASFDRMVAIATDLVRANGITHLVSGGAAWADHVAVALALNGVIAPANLTLRLPAPLKANQFDASLRDGSTANYYHGSFSKAVHRNTLAEIANVAEQGAKTTVNLKGFFARNVEVASDADVMLAFTFGSGSPWAVEKFAPNATAHDSLLKDGGTADTWNRAVAKKFHVTLGATA